MKVYAGKHQYPVNKGDMRVFIIRVTNAGNAGTLPKVKTPVSAPVGWNADIAPETIAGISRGESADVQLRIVPPGNYCGRRVQDNGEGCIRPDRSE